VACGHRLFVLARLAGIEPTTPWFVAKYSIQLSYSREALNYNPKIFPGCLPLESQAQHKPREHENRAYPQVLNVFKKRWFFALDFVANELNHPAQHK
jgi:hypothetical protein